jgi:hypothetical protein
VAVAQRTRNNAALQVAKVELAIERHAQLLELQKEVSGGHWQYQTSLQEEALNAAEMLNHYHGGETTIIIKEEKEGLKAADEVHAVRLAETPALPGCPDNVALAPGGAENAELDEKERLSAVSHLLQNSPCETVVEISTEIRSIGAAPGPRRSERKLERRSFLTTFADRISGRVSESIFL